ncbi:putative transcription factor interactor and regulator CCHC(Zn) family [Rosa chinensis]|uniref:Putative transcription factor interactor and regulator CCHC(Zn) family n=2 Tax=Rosa chinensis TaxID=74649 RepID=A0A2P6RH04_ROSCH|nr:putative transcription factor interactor and regulator CCHC(Zn) family [Rosa chinensis]
MPVNSMDMWSTSEEPAILPPQYSRQPGRPKTKRIKDPSEKLQDSVSKLGRVQRSLKCGNCNQVGHNVKTCQRHLPPKEKKTSAVSKKRKENNEAGQGSGNQSKRGKKGPMTANELRQKVKERAEYQRKKWAAQKAASLAENRCAPTRGRPRQATSAPTASRHVQATSTTITSRPPQAPRASTKQVATPTRSSQRIRENSGKGEGK